MNANVAAKADSFTSVPDMSSWQMNKDSKYVHITSNETIEGVAFAETPDTDGVPLVADMSSTILSQPIDVSKYGVIYAGAQKNIGPAGVTIVIVRNDLIGNARSTTPSMADAGSMLNTPPCYSWYMCGLVFAWLKQQGGVEAIAKVNARKAEKLYAAIDGSDFYNNAVVEQFRSKMNIPFTLADSELDKKFLEEASDVGLKFIANRLQHHCALISPGLFIGSSETNENHGHIELRVQFVLYSSRCTY